MRYWLVAAVALLSMGFSCRDPAGPPEDLEVHFEYGIQRLQTEPAFLVTPGEGTITVRGYFDTPCTPYSAVARANRTGTHMDLRLHGRQEGGCRQALGTAGYQATIRGVPAGTYMLSVFHEYPSGATTLFPIEPQVVVP